ncbi:hypothetical protein ACMA1I_08410 [Pontibacter sp. 13R65]|uniref:hypothetical protein n=1 Tax=Pontibacter sp. 13R65 TaxID=3127458 RepID=UPI00301D628D
MTLTELYSNEYARVETNAENHFIQVTWLQHASHTALREVLEKALQYAKPAKLNRWLFDMRKIYFVTSADQVWTEKRYFPSFDPALQHHVACVLSLLNAEMIPLAQDRVLSDNMEMQIFLDIEMAHSWLLPH